MPLAVRNVQRSRNPARIPDALAGAAQVLAELRSSGLLAELAAALRISRRGGYSARPMVAFLVALLASVTFQGIRPFATRFARPLKRVAAVAGCRSLPTSASVSRCLVRVTPEIAASFADRVLGLGPGTAAMLNDPSAVHTDAAGDPLHVIDIDPTVQAFRQRDLPEGDQLPPPKRVAPGVPGYTGQYRGEIRVRHVLACHAGCGLWLGYRLSENNPRLSELFAEVVRQAVNVLASASIAAERILVRGDGEFGSAGVLRALRALGVHVLVRLSRYNLLQRPEVAQALASATWSPLEIGAGSARTATDLGLVMLHPAAKSSDHGEPGIQVRVVVARRKLNGAEPRAGVAHDDYEYQLFATSLTANQASAADVVKLYAERAVIENRFAQEDRELDLGRTFSYHAPGQAVVTAVGLFLWNYWTCLGYRERMAMSPRSAAADHVAEEVPAEVLEPQHDLIEEWSPAAPASAVSLVEAASAEVPAEAVPTRTPSPSDPFPTATDADRRAMVAVVTRAFAHMPSPTWVIEPSGQLRCPNQRRLFPFSIANPGKGRPKAQMIVRTDVGACDGCPLRTGCFGSARPNTYRQVARALSDEDAAYMREFLDRHRPARTPPRLTRHPAPAHATDSPPPASTPQQSLVEPLPQPTISRGHFSRPTFEAAAARRLARRRYSDVGVEVRVGRAPPRGPAARATRRRTYQERDALWAHDVPVQMIRHCARWGPSDVTLFGLPG